MISCIPALEFLHSLCGTYHDQSTDTVLRVWQCGYGVAIDLTVQSKTTLCGVAGACKQDIECFVLCGFPNALRTLGRPVSESELSFVGDELPFEFRLARQVDGLMMTLILDGKTLREYELKAVKPVV